MSFYGLKNTKIESWTTGKANSTEQGTKEVSKNTTNLKSFYYLENGQVESSILETIESTTSLHSGIYSLGVRNENGQTVADLRVENDFEIPISIVEYPFREKVEEVYYKFFNPEIKSNINSLGYKHKVGMLLYGKAGTGKTSVLKEYFINSVKEFNSIVFNLRTYEGIEIIFDYISKIRKIQNNPIIIFMDEIDDGFENMGRSFEREIKTFMDGVNAIDNVFFMAATNYINKIPDTIKERPSRFKYCIQVDGIQDEITIGTFLKRNLETVGIDYDYSQDISKLKGYTVDELKEFVLDRIMDIKTQKFKKQTVGFKN